MTPETLKPCPFCGDTPRITEQVHNPGIGGSYVVSAELQHHCYGVRIAVDGRTKDEVMAEWNRRAERNRQ